MEEHALISELADQIARGERGPIGDADIERHLEALTVSSSMSIGEAARALGMLPTTIRYYEDAGLLTIPRAGNGHRIITPEIFSTLVFIHRMRLSGMPVHDIGHLQEHLDDGAPEAVHDARDLLEQHAATLRQQIAHLQITLAITEYKLHHLIGDAS